MGEFERVVAELYGMPRLGTDLGRFAKALGRLGNPQERFDSVNIVGTNGKGSTAAMVHSIMRESGLKPGLFTSPHLQDVRERIIVNGKLIGRKKFVRLFWETEAEGKMTFFEVVAAMAYLHFADSGVDYGVLEAGIGGRLDPTRNSRQRIVGICSIARDHEDLLGRTISQIAYEKAGIVKNGASIITLEEGAAAKQIKKACDTVGAKVVRPEIYVGKIGLDGCWQVKNASIAAGICKGIGIAEEHIRKGIGNVYWPCRLEKVSKKVMLDVAKNPAAWRQLSARVDSEGFDDLCVLFACRKGKGVGKGCFPKSAERVIATSFPPPPKCMDPKAIGRIAGCEVIYDLEDAFSEANGHKNVIVYGSFFLAGPISKKFYTITSI